MADLATPMALRVAVTLHLADRMDEEGTTAAQLAADTGTSPGALTRVLDHLVADGVFVEADGRYGLTELGRELNSSELRDRLDLTSAQGRAELAFVELLGAVTTGLPAYPLRYGRSFWEDLVDKPTLRQSFGTRRVRDQLQQVVSWPGWTRFAHVVDVGGGNGTFLTALLAAQPTLRATLVDIPAAAESASAAFKAAGITDRAAVVPGGVLDPLPVGHDAYLLVDILQNWDDAHAQKVLDGCVHAMSSTGAVVVIETLRSSMTDLAMLVLFGARQRSAAEMAELAAGCELELRETHDLTGHRRLLTFAAA